MDIKLEKKLGTSVTAIIWQEEFYSLLSLFMLLSFLPVPASFASTRKMYRLLKSKMINLWNM